MGPLKNYCLTQLDWLLNCHAERKKPLALSEVEGEASGLRTRFCPVPSVRFFAALRMTSWLFTIVIVHEAFWRHVSQLYRLLEVPESITTDMTTFTKDPAPIEARRDRIARVIAKLNGLWAFAPRCPLRLNWSCERSAYLLYYITWLTFKLSCWAKKAFSPERSRRGSIWP